MTNMLDEMTLKLNDFPEVEIQKIYHTFEVSMRKCYALFGEGVFCKPGIALLNRALFISFSIIMSYESRSEETLQQYRQRACAVSGRILLLKKIGRNKK